ncbi:hypothetical protein [Catalinimonas niigatensis]|uniref:hypothetical protein n=1 Tax=Catalinimonas niigatensis TaxID=1397264 RepID=UPI002666C0C4|nr:hypothetical protein [Catalinimonas niigatensis]WPP50932.1 hypothetical protein PZB72_00805 [Catalinimonas niigatensis]
MRQFSLIALFLFLYTGISAQGFNPGMEDDRHPYPFRAFLNKFSVNLSSGYARTFYRQEFTDFAYLRNQQGSFLINADDAIEGTTISGLNNWFSGVGTTNEIALNGEYKMIRFDSTDSPLRSSGYGVPINLAIYFNIFRLRLGGGASMEFLTANVTEPEDFLSPYSDPEQIKSRMTRYYFLMGYSIYEYYDLAFGIDIRAGKVNRGSGFDDTYIQSNPYFNIGVTFEKVYSEYFRVYLRPSYEFKSFEVSLPETAAQPSLTVNDNVFQLTLGLSINYPDLPRSPIPNDKTQMKHYVSDSKGNRMLVRGQPFWKKQDPKIGELYPELKKSKRKRNSRFLFFKKK